MDRKANRHSDKLVGNHTKKLTDELKIYRQTSEMKSILNIFLKLEDRQDGKTNKIIEIYY